MILNLRLIHPKHTTIKTGNKVRKLGGPKDSASTASVNSNSNQTNEDVLSREPSQCLGPECVNESKENSKYCSMECGLRLAKNRFLHFLRERFSDRLIEPSDADKLNQDALQKINDEIEMLNKKLGELEEKHADLDKIIERAKFASINPNIEVCFCLFLKKY